MATQEYVFIDIKSITPSPSIETNLQLYVVIKASTETEMICTNQKFSLTEEDNYVRELSYLRFLCRHNNVLGRTHTAKQCKCERYNKLENLTRQNTYLKLAEPFNTKPIK